MEMKFESCSSIHGVIVQNSKCKKTYVLKTYAEQFNSITYPINWQIIIYESINHEVKMKSSFKISHKFWQQH